MRSFTYPNLIEDEKTQNAIVQFIENYIVEHPKYHTLSGCWKFSERSNKWNSGNHLYLYLRGSQESLNYSKLVELMQSLIVDIGTTYGGPALQKALTASTLFNSVECNTICLPYYVRVLPGICVDALIACGLQKFQKETFLKGLECKSSTIYKKFYDGNILNYMLRFFEPVTLPKKEVTPDPKKNTFHY